MIKCMLTASLLLLAGQAGAVEMPRCAPLPAMRDLLKTAFNEIEVGGGLVNETTVNLLFASPDGETWTVLAVTTDGNACAVSSGRNWFQARIPAKGERPA